MGFPTVTYSFSNSTTADATQVNQNFTDLINGVSDGTKNLSISAFTAAGATTLNGAVTLGASSANLLVFNGSVNSSIPINTNTSYDIGSSTLGVRSVYIGASSTNTVRLLGGSGSTYTITLPGAVPTFSKSGLYSDTSGTLTFDQRTVRTVKSSTTTTYTALGGDEIIPCSASGGSFTITLPSPSATGMTGKKLTFIRTDQTLANAVTITHNVSETINGANSITLNTQYEMYELITDGTNWYILNHTYPKTWTSYTPTATGLGTVSGVSFFYRRVGDSIEVVGYLTAGTTTATATTITWPSGLTPDTSKIPGDQKNLLGWWELITSSGTPGVLQQPCPVFYDSSNSTTGLCLGVKGASGGLIVGNGSDIINSGYSIALNFTMPVSGWVS